jgi:hypothetical protein
MAKFPRGWGMLLLAIFLILWGVAQFGVINLSAGWLDVHKLAACVGIAAGILLLLNK